VILWRIATETRRYPAADLSGAGAARNPGRWNEDGQAMVYASLSISLAVLETAAHVNDMGLPLNRFVVRIDVPQPVWNAREEKTAASLPPGWSAIPAGVSSVKVGAEWHGSLRSAILLVPSVIVPEESTVLIHPGHADAAKITATVVRAFDYNRLIRSERRTGSPR
jgi:RES domain-containing protein